MLESRQILKVSIYMMAFWWFRRLFYHTCLKGMTGEVSCISGFTQKLAVSSGLLRNWQCLTQQVHHSYGTAPFSVYLVSSLYIWAMRCKCIFIYMHCVSSVKWMNHWTIVHDIDIPFELAYESPRLRKPGRTRQEVIQLKSLILLKRGTNLRSVDWMIVAKQ